jgi:hypothetical protein
MAAALTEPASLDELAADYAAIYLNNSTGRLALRIGLAVRRPPGLRRADVRTARTVCGSRPAGADWRSRFDDHFVLQLQYLQHCCTFRQRAGRRPASSTNMSATGFPTSPSAFPCSAPRRSMPRWPN